MKAYYGTADELIDELANFHLQSLKNPLTYVTKDGWNCATAVSNPLQNIGTGAGLGAGLACETSVMSMLENKRGAFSLIGRVEDYGWEKIPIGSVMMRAKNDFEGENYYRAHTGVLIAKIIIVLPPMIPGPKVVVIPIIHSFSGSEGKVGKSSYSFHGKYSYFRWIKHLKPQDI